MSEMINITIDGKKIKAKPGQTVLEVAQEHKIDIPFLCFHPDLDVKANCRICVVEIKGKNGQHTACSTKVEEGMEITTRSEKIERSRKTNLELIFAHHKEECDDCILYGKCPLLKYGAEYKANMMQYKDRKRLYPSYQFGPSIYFDTAKCIDCKNCVEMCDKQGVGFLEIVKEKGFNQTLPTKDPNKDCIYCGQCITHCPVGAFEAVSEFEAVKEPFHKKKPNQTVIAMIAPSIRVTIGEEFDMPYGSIATEQVVAGLKKMGADYVFDVSLGADFVTVAEADELLERVESGEKLPMFNSCCPAWVKYVEFFYPQLLGHLTTVVSPQIALARLIKTYWAKKANLNPENMVVVSIMPCTAKKYEIKRKELEIDGEKSIDYVMTVRELAFLFKKGKIDLKTIKGEQLDDPLGVHSGAGVIFGASGGVTEATLRSVCDKLTDNRCPVVKFEQVRDIAGAKETTVDIGGKKLKICVVNPMGEAKKVLDKIAANPGMYDYVEVMACPGGCIGGGGEPVPVDEKIRQARRDALYAIDDKKEIRMADQNPVVQQVLAEFLNDKDVEHKIMHTTYSRKTKENEF